VIQLNGLSEVERNIIDSSEGWTLCSPLNKHLLMESVRYVYRNNLPGDIVECGVWRGGMMQIVARTLISETQKDSNPSNLRKLWLFDTFEGMPAPSHELDRDMYKGEHASAKMKREPKIGPNGTHTIWCLADLDDVVNGMDSTDYPSGHVNYVKGLVEETLPNSSLEKISILRVDTDWYSSTKHILKSLYEKVVSGGVVIFDDYESWEGARTAVNEFFTEEGIAPLLIRLDKGRVYLKP
jgi:O-methyltransferase